VTPLDLAIIVGDKDKQLLSIIWQLEQIRDYAVSAPLSQGELDTLALAYERLDIITTPQGSDYAVVRR
jgi:hypothetical protein